MEVENQLLGNAWYGTQTDEIWDSDTVWLENLLMPSVKIAVFHVSLFSFLCWNVTLNQQPFIINEIARGYHTFLWTIL